MVAKAPWQPPVLQTYDWTALYVGGHTGYAGGRSNWRSPPDLASSFSLFQSSDIFNGSGSYFGGLQIGYDYMLPNRVVLGAQLDASFPGFPNIDGISIGGFSIFSTPASGLASYSESVLLSGTARARVGYAPGNWLFYATGGFAWTYNQLSLIQLTDGTFDAPFLWRLGWAAGGGVEWAFAPNWSVSVEYLHTQYGNSSVLFPTTGLQFTSDFSLQQVRAGLNYRFGGGTNTNGGSIGLPTPATDIVNFHGQTTFVWQGYPAIRSPYTGPFSLPGSGLGRETFDT
ncbi:MAG TPA: outer membrane beta-barrel protein, partial [Xanthobacteraceae bacterium]|nr:outer membrane beta-barrel protein [Xanthobacteraceae bacterium]